MLLFMAGVRDIFILFVIAVVAIPLVWLLIRDHPPESEVNSASGEEVLPGVTLQEAIRTRVFWSIAALFLLVALSPCLALFPVLSRYFRMPVWMQQGPVN